MLAVSLDKVVYNNHLCLDFQQVAFNWEKIKQTNSKHKKSAIPQS